MQYGKKDRREFAFNSHFSALCLALSSVNLVRCVVVNPSYALAFIV